MLVPAGNTKGGSITVPLTSCLTGLDKSVLQIKTKIVSWHAADSKPVKQDFNGTVILPPLVFPGLSMSKNAFDLRSLILDLLRGAFKANGRFQKLFPPLFD